jgi:hypothetical protein
VALDFDGVDDIAQNLNGIAALDTSDWTKAAWVNADSGGEGNNGSIISVQNTDTQRSFIRHDAIAARSVNASDNGATDAALTTSTQIAATTWTLVIGTFNAVTGRCRVFFGDLSTPVALQGSSVDNALVTKVAGSNRVSIGNQNLGDRTYDGRISRAGIWTRILSPDEMDSLRRGNVPLSQCVRFWPLGDDGQASNKELIGGFDLTITGAVDAAGPSLPFAADSALASVRRFPKPKLRSAA